MVYLHFIWPWEHQPGSILTWWQHMPWYHVYNEKYQSPESMV